jgi:hypothetical protein
MEYLEFQLPGVSNNANSYKIKFLGPNKNIIVVAINIYLFWLSGDTLDSILRIVKEKAPITNLIAMNDVILVVYSGNSLGLGIYYDPSKLDSKVASSL